MAAAGEGIKPRGFSIPGRRFLSGVPCSGEAGTPGCSGDLSVLTFKLLQESLPPLQEVNDLLLKAVLVLEEGKAFITSRLARSQRMG